ncbi:MAG: LamG-like jellyroll fold domain-containing protein [Chthoniobacterales bacterium]
MKNKRTFLWCLMIGLAGIHSVRSHAAEPSFYYYFEDNNDPSMPTNSGEAPFALRYLGDTQQTTTQHKFGKGSMLISELKGEAFLIGKGTGVVAMPSEFSDAISKMTITAWVRPSLPPEGQTNCFKPGFNILDRLVPEPATGGSRGLGCFIYCFINGAFQLTYCSDGDKKVTNLRSAPIKYVESEEWVHMAVTFDAGKAVFYFNGLPVGDADGSLTGAANISEVQGRGILAGFFNSHPGDSIDDFGFFVDRALTEAEMDTVYNKGLEAFVKSGSAALKK